MSNTLLDTSDNLSRLYRDHHNWLKGWLRGRLGDVMDAEDLAQDSFVRVIHSPQPADRLREPRRFLVTIAKGLTVDLFRRHRQRLETGQQLNFTRDSLSPVAPADPHAGSWIHGSLMVVDMPLRELLVELERYRKGLLVCSDEIAGLKISGAFPLGDTDRALAAITRAFPVREQRLTRYWVRLTGA